MRLCFRFDWLLFVLEELQKGLLTNFSYISIRCRSGNKKLMIIYLSFFCILIQEYVFTTCIVQMEFIIGARIFSLQSVVEQYR